MIINEFGSNVSLEAATDQASSRAAALAASGVEGVPEESNEPMAKAPHRGSRKNVEAVPWQYPKYFMVQYQNTRQLLEVQDIIIESKWFCYYVIVCNVLLYE